MIISHEHRYLFVQLPHTGCTAVARELCEHYGGEPTLRKHAFYHQFLRQASPDERSYFTFSTIRNPMDDVISVFYKYATNHESYDDPTNASGQGGFVTERMRRRFEWVQSHPDAFDDYFRRFHRVPYDNWSRLDHDRFDYVMRFERLQEDFSEALSRIGVEQVRPIPVHNATRRERADAASHFEGPLRDRARWIFGPFMERWGYDFPSDWGSRRSSVFSRALYDACGAAKSLRWRRM